MWCVPPSCQCIDMLYYCGSCMQCGVYSWCTVLLGGSIQCSFSLMLVLDGAMAPASNPPHTPSLNSTAVPPPPPPGGDAGGVSLPASTRQASSTHTHPAGKNISVS